MREEAEVELDVWPCEMYQHVISPFRRDKDKSAYLSAKKIEMAGSSNHPLQEENPDIPGAASSFHNRGESE
jgi:hypothetical protein